MPTAPASGQYTLEVKTIAHDRTFIYINGVGTFTTDNAAAVQSTKQNVNDGKLVVALQFTTDTDVGIFMGALFLNGQPIASTGDFSNWKVYYLYNGANPPVGWNSDPYYNDSTWLNWTGTCTPRSSAFSQMASGMAVNGAQPQFVLGPCKVVCDFDN